MQTGKVRRNFVMINAVLGLIVITGAALVFAAGEAPAGISADLIAKAEGSSGWKWIGGNQGSPFMNPGRNCIACHDKGDGPRFLSAGTVYVNLNEKDLWLGSPGAIVQITDSKGLILKMETNAAGNFMLNFHDASISFPIKAKVIFKTKERIMFGSKSSAECMTCHSAPGKNGAPGRIILP